MDVIYLITIPHDNVRANVLISIFEEFKQILVSAIIVQAGCDLFRTLRWHLTNGEF